MSKRFKLVDVSKPVTPTPKLDWELCVLCQADKEESLQCPAATKRKDSGAGYKTFEDNMLAFSELGELPQDMDLQQLDEGQGIAATLAAHQAKWHKSCKVNYNTTKLQRAQKRGHSEGSPAASTSTDEYKRTRSKAACVDNIRNHLCFFCHQQLGSEFHQVATLELDKHVRNAAEFLKDTTLLAQLSAGDMVAREAKYHKKCLTSLYNRVRAAKTLAEESQSKVDVISAIVLAELVTFIEETAKEEDTAPVFKIADLTKLYTTRMEQLGIVLETRVRTTRLKERILAHFPDLQEHRKGRDILLVYKEDIGSALAKACQHDIDSDAVHLARAARIIRKDIFQSSQPFNGSFSDKCQQESVPQLLLTMVSMMLEGAGIKNQARQSSSSASLTIAQLIKYNSVKHERRAAGTDVPHSISQETPLPIYLGLMLHAHTRKRELVDTLSGLGISIAYDRVLRISAELGNGTCQRFQMEKVVCPPKLRSRVFTTSAVDNIDHNPSSTTAHDSFHGTGISLIQHPDYDNQGTDRGIVIIGGISNVKAVGDLPRYYTDVQPVTSPAKKKPVPAGTQASLQRNPAQAELDKEKKWLQAVKDACDSGDTQNPGNISWAAHHAESQAAQHTNITVTPTALLPLFHDQAHSVAMIRHAMDVVKAAVNELNPGQIPVITLDQPLYAIAKEVQWNWPDTFGEDLFVVMLGALHTEMAAWKTAGNWLQDSGWTQALVQAEIATTGTADSFLHAAHVSRTRRAHQVTAAALHILQHHAYSRYKERATARDEELLQFEAWCDMRAVACPQFQYWATVLHLEVSILLFIRSLRESNFTLYMDTLPELAAWFAALDHVHYARWLPVHIRDMVCLAEKHPDVAAKFHMGHFTFKKTRHAFSAIALDQAHEQNNAMVKGDGGAVGLTENPSALRRWMVAGPEVARVITEFETSKQLHQRGEHTHHHEQTNSVQKKFVQDVRALTAVIEEMGNPFEEESTDLLVLDTQEILGLAAVESVRTAVQMGRDQFHLFEKERLADRSKPLNDVIKRNKLPLFASIKVKSANKSKQQLASARSDSELFSRLYIACQTRDGDLEQFFKHENSAHPPALSQNGQIRFGSKSDLLRPLEQLVEPKSHPPQVSSVILDGAAVVQMLNPGQSKTFLDYATDVFVPYILSQLQNHSRLDLVWDRYANSGSLKATARANRGKGIRRRVTGTTLLPGNWDTFLRVDENKEELFSFLSKQVMESINVPEKQLVATDGEQVI